MRIRYRTILLVVCIFVATVSCSVTSIFGGGTEVEFHEDRVVCASIAQGSPLFVYLDIPRGRNEDALLFTQTRWEYEAWLSYQNMGKWFYVKKEREGKDPKKIIPLEKNVTSVRTEKDQLVFGVNGDQHDILIVTDPIYPDRSHKVVGANIEYSLLPVKIYIGKKMIPGSGFYQHIAYVGKIRPPSSPSRLYFLNHGTFCYLWDRTGNFWYIEHLLTEEVDSTFAATQDPRGEWEDTYEGTVTSSGSEQMAGESNDTNLSWTITLPAWQMEAHLSRVRTDNALAGDVRSLDQKGQNNSLGGLEEGFPNYPSLSMMRFYEVEGTLQMENETRTVYGIVQFCCPKKR